MKNSLAEVSFIPSWAKDYKETIFFICNGASMAPLFKPGDLLCCRKEKFENVCLGDIIIVAWKNDKKHTEYIVHRSVSIKPDYLTTQGDNNLEPDVQVVTKKNFVGLVTSFSRQNRVCSVNGGYIGLIYAHLFHARNYIWLFVRRLGWRIYRLTRQSGLVARAWHPTISQIRVMTDQGFLIKYCHGNHTVARWWPETKKFDVVKPFDLVIPHPEESK
jgi:signal peptidase I